MVKFDKLDEILAGYTIKKVALELFFEEITVKEPGPNTKLNAQFSPLMTAWDEESATWYKASSTVTWKEGTDVDLYVRTFDTTDGYQVNQWHEYDITSFENLHKGLNGYKSVIQEMVDKPEKNHGFLIKGHTAIGFRYTSCQGDNPEHYPRLRVTVEEPVSTQSIKSNKLVSQILIDKQQKMIKYLNAANHELSFKVISAKGVSIPIQVVREGSDFIYSYSRLPNGVYFFNFYNHLNGKKELLKVVNY